MRKKFVVLGAGPTGLGAAYRLKELEEKEFLVIEKNPWVGGLAASFADKNGFTWDIGGHIQFSHYLYFDNAMDQAFAADGWLHHQRESWVRIHNRFVPYPFQNNLRYLPQESLHRCLKGLIDNKNTPSTELPTNFHEWLVQSFGRGLADEFMLPYNRKVWAYPLNQLSFQWIGERVATVDLPRLLKNVLFEKDDVGWGPNSTFRFPRFGGTGAIWNSIAKKIGKEHIKINARVTGISAKDKCVVLEDGSRIFYSHLLSTIPLDKLGLMVKELPNKLRKTACQLKHSSAHIVGVGLKGNPSEELTTKCWMYFPERNCPFYRVTLFSNYSPNNVPDINQQFSLMAETAQSPHKHVTHSTIAEETIQGLLNTGLMTAADEIISTWHFVADYGYPTPSLERDEILSKIIPALENMGVFSRGRFGGWKYEVSNQDHTFMQGVEWVDKIVSNKPETTFTM